MNAGHVDRSWGRTLVELAATRRSGELVVRDHDRVFRIAIADGRIANAHSPVSADGALQIAQQIHLVSQAQAPSISRHLEADAGGDEVAIIADCAKLAIEATIALRRRVIAQRAARTFELTDGAWLFSPEPVLSFRANDIDVRAVIYLGARLYLSDERLRLPVGEYRLCETPLDGFELRELEQRVIAQLAAGASIAEVEVAQRGIETHTLHALFYALASGGAIELATAELAIGTVNIPPRSRSSTPIALHIPRRRTPSVKIPAIVVALAKEAASEPDD